MAKKSIVEEAIEEYARTHDISKEEAARRHLEEALKTEGQEHTELAEEIHEASKTEAED